MKKHNGKNLNKHSVSCLIIASLLALASCSYKSDSQVDEKAITQKSVEETYNLNKIQFESSDMKLGKIEMRTFHEVVKAKGIFDVPPGNRASVSSYFGGTVKELRLLPGERVKKGQVLFTLENPDFVQIQQDFLETKGQLAYLKSDYERQKNLVQDNVSSKKTFLKAESDYTVSKVKLKSLSKKLILMNINPNSLTLDNIRTTISVPSPIDGHVTQVNITRGSFIIPSQSAINIVNTDYLHLELNIFEKDLPRVSIGQKIQFRIQEDKSKEYKAAVHLVNKTVDPINRTIGIHGHLTNKKISSRFSPGMYVEADIYSTSVSRASLPEDTLVEIEGKYYALVLQGTSNNGYSFVKKEVKGGKSNNGFVEILNPHDFNDSTLFLTIGAFNLITE